jgi:hypothetical protein
MQIPEGTKPHTIAQWESVVKHKNYRFLGIDIEISSFHLYKGFVMSVKGSFCEAVKSGDNLYEYVENNCIWNYRGECFNETSLDRIESGDIIFNDSTDLKYHDNEY